MTLIQAKDILSKLNIEHVEYRKQDGYPAWIVLKTETSEDNIIDIYLVETGPISNRQLQLRRAELIDHKSTSNRHINISIYSKEDAIDYIAQNFAEHFIELYTCLYG